ncbi:MAG: Na+/H+ antiporter NhaC [Chromatocurvus sp.]
MTDHSHDNPRLTPWLALAPVLVLVTMLACSAYLFGADASYGPNQIALVLCTGVAAIVGSYTGLRWTELQEGIIDGIGLGLAPTLILLAVGMLIGTWILAGTVPTLIYYGVQILNPSLFYAASAVICAIVALSTGSSWTVAGTLGIGLMGIAATFDLSPAITGGAIVSGAYFGDKLSPMSDTTNLAAASTNVDLFEHIRHMLWTTVPGFVIALLIFAMMGSASGAAAPEKILSLQRGIAQEFNIGAHLLLPMLLMLYLIYRRFPAYPAIIISAVAGGIFALVFQPGRAIALAGDADLATGFALTKGIWISLYDGYISNSGNEDLDKLLSKGGMSSMLNTVWLIICGLGFGGILERIGIIRYGLALALRGVQSTGSLVARTVATCFSANILTADQFLSVALPGRMYRDAYIARGLSPLNLSRTLEDSATLTSALIPWNSCGAYMAATLGIATFSYAPFAFFNLACPLLAIAYGYLNFAQRPLEERYRPPTSGAPAEA